MEAMTLPQVLPLLVRRRNARLELVDSREGGRIPEGVGVILRFRPVQLGQVRGDGEVSSPTSPQGS